MLKLKFKVAMGLFIAVISQTVIFSCTNHDLGPIERISCDGFKTVSYLNDIKPIITDHCAIEGCHNGDNGADKNWTEPGKLQDHAAEARRRVQLPKTDGDHMPRVGEISDEQIKLIVCWAEQGAPINN
jgi:hypothetical protein